MKLIWKIILLGLFVASCGQYKNLNQSRVDTVHVPQSQGEDQGKSSFCWSYSIMAFLESRNLAANDPIADLNLSEEYLGFYRMFQDLKQVMKDENPAKSLSWIKQSFKTWDGFVLVDEVGVVPENIFPYKNLKLEGKSLEYLSNELSKSEKLEQIRTDPKALQDLFAEAFGIKDFPMPDEQFEYQGKTMTPRIMLHEVLGFNSNDYQFLRNDNQNKFYESLKKSLLAGYSVPVGIFGHAILAVDFISKGGRGGQMTEEEIKTIINEPIEEIIVKDSYEPFKIGQDGQTNDDDKTNHYRVLKAEEIMRAIIHKKFLE